MTICSQICSIVDKIRPVVGILIGVGRFAMGVANFLIVMNEGYFIFTLPIIFLLNGIFMLFCTCGLFMRNPGYREKNDGTSRETHLQ